MSTNVLFYVICKNKETNEYDNISPRTENGKIIPIYSGYSDTYHAAKDIIEKHNLEPDFLKHLGFNVDPGDYYSNYCLGNFKDIKKYTNHKLMYLHYSFFHTVKNGKINAEEDIWYFDEKEADNFPAKIEPEIYYQLLPEEKQKYIPVIEEDYCSDEAVLSRIKEYTLNWIEEFEWVYENYKKYDFDDVKFLIAIL